MQTDVAVIEELRRLARNGVRPSDLARVVAERLGIDPPSSRLHVIAYFREAFCLSLGDAKRIGALPMFSTEGRANTAVDGEMATIIETNRSLWAATPAADRGGSAR